MGRVQPRTDKGFSAENRIQHIDSAVSEGIVKYGLGVVYGSNAADLKGTAYEVTPQVEAFDGGTGAKLAGIATDSTKPGMDEQQYNDQESVSVLRKGIVYVEVDESSTGVEAGDKVALMPGGDFDVTQAGGGSTGTYALNINDAQFKTSGEAGEIVVLEINLPCGYEEVQI